MRAVRDPQGNGAKDGLTVTLTDSIYTRVLASNIMRATEQRVLLLK